MTKFLSDINNTALKIITSINIKIIGKINLKEFEQYLIVPVQSIEQTIKSVNRKKYIKARIIKTIIMMIVLKNPKSNITDIIVTV